MKNTDAFPSSREPAVDADSRRLAGWLLETGRHQHRLLAKTIRGWKTMVLRYYFYEYDFINIIHIIIRIIPSTQLPSIDSSLFLPTTCFDPIYGSFSGGIDA
jgi:hypothetical protein